MLKMTVPAAATRLTPGFCHGRRTRLGGGLDGICHLGRAASLPKAAGERQKQALKSKLIIAPECFSKIRTTLDRWGLIDSQSIRVWTCSAIHLGGITYLRPNDDGDPTRCKSRSNSFKA